MISIEAVTKPYIFETDMTKSSKAYKVIIAHTVVSSTSTTFGFGLLIRGINISHDCYLYLIHNLNQYMVHHSSKEVEKIQYLCPSYLNGVNIIEI